MNGKFRSNIFRAAFSSRSIVELHDVQRNILFAPKASFTFPQRPHALELDRTPRNLGTRARVR